MLRGEASATRLWERRRGGGACRPRAFAAPLVQVVIAALCAPAARGQAVDVADLVYPPHAEVHGKTLMEWGAEWWRWILGIESTANPVRDFTGARCGLGQGGPVFFLAGTDISGSFQRACTVPAGREIFFPLSNAVGGAGPGEPEDCEFWRRQVEDYMNAVCELSCELDGQAIRGLGDHREQSSCFEVILPANNLFIPESICLRTAVADGYWLMLKPLSAGKHQLKWAGKICGQNPQGGDMTFELTVGEPAAPPSFSRGDSNGDGKVNLSDAVGSLNYLFLGGASPACPDAADSQDDGKLDIADPVYLLNWLFLGGCVLAWPPPGSCGSDPHEDALPECSASCP
ncbi:MAG: hypothetical protein HY721_08345 [Planctomycetes bacterium]|nr:hypothetical protein [Planctomycetota bacterium]